MKNLNLPYHLRLLFVVILAISLSCSENTQKEKNSFYTVPFAEIVKNKREVKLSEFATDVELIQLENTPEALLGTFENIEFTKDYIFVMCWAQPILQFSRTGKLVRQIGAIGKGPKEYFRCLKISIDEKGEKVYVHTTEQSMMVYNFNGEFLKTIKFPALQSMMNFWIWSRDSILVSYFEPVEGNEPNVIIEHNEQGDTLQSISNYIFFDRDDKANPFHMSSFKEQNFAYRFENKLHMKGFYNDTVYSYDENNKIVPKFFIDLKEHKLPNDLIYERRWTRSMPDDLCWAGVHETSNYIFIPYGYHFDIDKPQSQKEEKGYILYNKNTKEGLAVEETKQGGFVDDMTGGPDFRPTVTNDHTAIMLISALDMKQYLDSDKFKNHEVKSPEEKEKLNQLKKTLKEEDNHLVVLVNLKDK